MNLLTDRWIPVRSVNGVSEGRLLTLEELLCGDDRWEIALPRDDLEMACLQLLVSLVQIAYPPGDGSPEDDKALRERTKSPLTPEAFAEGLMPIKDWFTLDHPQWPFLQTRGVKPDKITGLHKLLLGLPEGNNHAFFNEANEITVLGSPATAIALFHQAVNCPSFGGGPGGGFKASLRGNAPITTLVAGGHLRETVWRNVLTRKRVSEMLPNYKFDFSSDQPTWVQPIKTGTTHALTEIGLLRGLFWQPAHVELVRSPDEEVCGLLGGEADEAYLGFYKEPFGYKVEGIWPHPHSPLRFNLKAKKEGDPTQKFLSFTTTAPAWTQLTEFVVPRGDRSYLDVEGVRPALPVTQFGIWRKPLYLLVGGYRVENGAALRERRHEMVSLANGWEEAGEVMRELINLALDAQKALNKRLSSASKNDKKKGLKGIGVELHQIGNNLFFRRTERPVLDALADAPFDDDEGSRFNAHREKFVADLSGVCKEIFTELTDPYAMKPELVPIIAHARAGLHGDLRKLINSTKGGTNS
jgi:CRISPR system Cascade subunit CasA